VVVLSIGRVVIPGWPPVNWCRGWRAARLCGTFNYWSALLRAWPANVVYWLNLRLDAVLASQDG
jgi:hypothetical protein